MDKQLKRTLVNALKESSFAETDSNDWKKAPEKVKTKLILEEAAKGIAKKKIEIQQIIEEK